MQLLTKEIREKLLRNGNATRTAQRANAAEPDHTPILKIFAPEGAATWLITEIDEDGDTLYGLCDLGLGDPELGYVSLSELSGVRTARLRLPLERDAYFTPKGTLAQYTKAAKKAGRIVALNQ